LEINDRKLASITFLAETYGNMPEAEKVKIIENLKEYFGMDNEGMIWIVERLRKVVRAFV